jgi:hypothetical protein
MKACKHCGSMDDLILNDKGHKTGVCRPCRRIQINISRSGANANSRSQDKVRRPTVKISKRPIDQGAISRAVMKSNEGMKLVDALREEGVI